MAAKQRADEAAKEAANQNKEREEREKQLKMLRQQAEQARVEHLIIIIIIIIYSNLLYSFIRLAGYVFVLTFYKIQEAPMSGMTVTLVRCPFSFSEQ